MNFTIYILLGILFTILLEAISGLESVKEHLSKEYQFSFMERIVSILGWPILLLIFLYNFFKTYFDL